MNNSKIYPGRKPQGGAYAYWRDRGRVWVERVWTLQNPRAHVRFDPNTGMRSRVYTAPLDQIDFEREWK